MKCILLTTPFVYDPGHGKPTETSTHVQVIKMINDTEAKYTELEFHYGNSVGGEWVRSPLSPSETFRLEDIPPSPPLFEGTTTYSDLISVMFPASLSWTVYDNAQYVTYLTMQAQGLYPGTIV